MHAPTFVEQEPSALEIAERYSAGWSSRIRFYRRLGILSLLALTVPGAAIPVCIVAAHRFAPFYLGELAPTMLGALTVIGGALTLHIRPFERLQMLRENLVALRSERRRFVRGMPPYDRDDREFVFVDRIEAIRRQQYLTWASVLPKSRDVVSTHVQ